MGRATDRPDSKTRHPTACANGGHPPPTDTLAPLLEELRLLREEVAGLRAELRLIEHKPEAAKYPEKVEKPQSFADLLASLDGK